MNNFPWLKIGLFSITIIGIVTHFFEVKPIPPELLHFRNQAEYNAKGPSFIRYYSNSNKEIIFYPNKLCVTFISIHNRSHFRVFNMLNLIYDDAFGIVKVSSAPEYFQNLKYRFDKKSACGNRIYRFITP